MISYFERIKRMNDLIVIGKTGNPREFAAKMDMSDRSIYEYLKVMKAMGAPIFYNKGRRSYVYSASGSFKVGFEDVRGC